MPSESINELTFAGWLAVFTGTRAEFQRSTGKPVLIASGEIEERQVDSNGHVRRCDIRLLIHPDLDQVEVPLGKALEQAISKWNIASEVWRKVFNVELDRTLAGMDDEKTKEAIEQQALKLLHAI